MGFFGNLFSSKNNVSQIDKVLIKQLAWIESMLLNQSDFIRIFGSDDRNALEMLCNKNESSFPYLNLALIHMYGINVERDFDKAEDLLLKSTALGNPFAYKYLALIEEEIKHNLTKGISYLKKGCDAGDVAAMTNLAGYYMEGSGVSIDKDEAIRLWKKAAKLGSKVAAMNLQRAGA